MFIRYFCQWSLLCMYVYFAWFTGHKTTGVQLNKRVSAKDLTLCYIGVSLSHFRNKPPFTVIYTMVCLNENESLKLAMEKVQLFNLIGFLCHRYLWAIFRLLYCFYKKHLNVGTWNDFFKQQAIQCIRKFNKFIIILTLLKSSFTVHSVHWHFKTKL